MSFPNFPVWILKIDKEEFPNSTLTFSGGSGIGRMLAVYSDEALAHEIVEKRGKKEKCARLSKTAFCKLLKKCQEAGITHVAVNFEQTGAEIYLTKDLHFAFCT